MCLNTPASKCLHPFFLFYILYLPSPSLLDPITDLHWHSSIPIGNASGILFKGIPLRAPTVRPRAKQNGKKTSKRGGGENWSSWPGRTKHSHVQQLSLPPGQPGVSSRGTGETNTLRPILIRCDVAMTIIIDHRSVRLVSLSFVLSRYLEITLCVLYHGIRNSPSLVSFEVTLRYQLRSHTIIKRSKESRSSTSTYTM